MKIGIIGCGYVGTAIARIWHQADHSLTLTTTTPSKVAELSPLAKQVIVLKGNDPKALLETIQEQEVILLSVANRNLYEETYLGTAKTLLKVLPFAPNIKQIIYTSSHSVLGNQQGKWATEETPTAPFNNNGQILAETERVLLSAASNDVKVCIFRLAGIYGLNRELIKIFGRWSAQTRPGTGEEYSQWIHLDDIVAALDFALQKRLDGVYNLANEYPLRKKDLLAQLFAAHQLPSVLWDSELPAGNSCNTRLSVDKLKSLGFCWQHPQITFK